MAHIKVTKPASSEYSPYYKSYIARVPGDDVVAALTNQISSSQNLIRGIPEEKGDFRYAEGKWNIRELIGHVIDTERVMAYRALRFARNDPTPLAGFDQDPYVKYSNSEGRSLDSLRNEFTLLREANLCMFLNFDEDAWGRTGTANGHPVSARALSYIIAGHEIHHFNILRERYLI